MQCGITRVPGEVADENGTSLGLCYSSKRSLEYALEHGVGAYESRNRGLWVKGLTSGNTQELYEVPGRVSRVFSIDDLDCVYGAFQGICT